MDKIDIEAEIRRAYKYGQINNEMMESGLERDEVDEYARWRMIHINKQIKDG